MDIAAMSVALENQQVQSDASLQVMSKTKDYMEEQGEQLVDMLQSSQKNISHPDLGKSVDISV